MRHYLFSYLLTPKTKRAGGGAHPHYVINLSSVMKRRRSGQDGRREASQEQCGGPREGSVCVSACVFRAGGGADLKAMR